MRYYIWFLACMIGCVSLPKLPPASRTPDQVKATSVEVVSYCGNNTPRAGHGVVISERHVLTAQHIVDCPSIPLVKVYRKGERELLAKMVVTREDPTADIAKLEVMHAGRLHINVPPPALFPADDTPTNEIACTQAHVFMCGVVWMDPTILEGMEPFPGDSGAGVYSSGIDFVTDSPTGKCGLLIGIIIRKGDGYTRIAPIDSSWLEGVK